MQYAGRVFSAATDTGGDASSLSGQHYPARGPAARRTLCAECQSATGDKALAKVRCGFVELRPLDTVYNSVIAFSNAVGRCIAKYCRSGLRKLERHAHVIGMPFTSRRRDCLY
jgi:hypothetical protein